MNHEITPWMPAQRRVALALFLGLVAGVGAAWFAPWQLALMIGFDTWAAIQLIWVGSIVLPLDAARTRLHAQREDDSRTIASLVVLSAAIAGLVAVVLGLVKANHEHGAPEAVTTVFAVTTVALAWLTVHIVFILRYADLYYDEPVGGIVFPATDDPDYRDFCYVGFSVGMTFQVSDTNVEQREIRRTITRHALISYVFGTAIIGVTINVMAGLIG